MAIEIEHKFLLANNAWRLHIDHSVSYRQGYLSTAPTSSMRVRTSDKQAWLNIKSATIGTQRHEFEYEIPLSDANTLLHELCTKPLIEKVRHCVYAHGKLWEIDEFSGANAGLLVAEIELNYLDEIFIKPDWVGEEVTYDPRYYNNNLATLPYSEWTR